MFSKGMVDSIVENRQEVWKTMIVCYRGLRFDSGSLVSEGQDTLLGGDCATKGR